MLSTIGLQFCKPKCCHSFNHSQNTKSLRNSLRFSLIHVVQSKAAEILVPDGATSETATGDFAVISNHSSQRDNRDAEVGVPTSHSVDVDLHFCLSVFASQFSNYPNVTTLRSGLCYRNSVCRLSVVCRLSSVCNVGAPYSGG